MDNNELFKRLRYALKIDDAAAKRILQQGGLAASIEQVSAWRLADDAAEYEGCPNEAISAFLAGYVVERRGVQEGKPVPPPSKTFIKNNIVLKMMKIALALRGEELHAILLEGGASLTENEVSALLRKPGSRNYRECGDQVLRQLMNGIGKNLRDAAPTSSVWDDAAKKKNND